MKKTKLKDNCNILKEQIKEHTNFNRARIFVIVGLIESSYSNIILKLTPYPMITRFGVKYEMTRDEKLCHISNEI